MFFKIKKYRGDKAFNIKALETSSLPGLLHIYAKNEHIGIIERSIYTTKERTRSTRHAITFKIYTSLMKSSLIEGLL